MTILKDIIQFVIETIIKPVISDDGEITPTVNDYTNLIITPAITAKEKLCVDF